MQKRKKSARTAEEILKLIYSPSPQVDSGKTQKIKTVSDFFDYITSERVLDNSIENEQWYSALVEKGLTDLVGRYRKLILLRQIYMTEEYKINGNSCTVFGKKCVEILFKIIDSFSGSGKDVDRYKILNMLDKRLLGSGYNDELAKSPRISNLLRQRNAERIQNKAKGLPSELNSLDWKIKPEIEQVLTKQVTTIRVEIRKEIQRLNITLPKGKNRDKQDKVRMKNTMLLVLVEIMRRAASENNLQYIYLKRATMVRDIINLQRLFLDCASGKNERIDENLRFEVENTKIKSFMISETKMVAKRESLGEWNVEALVNSMSEWVEGTIRQEKLNTDGILKKAKGLVDGIEKN